MKNRTDMIGYSILDACCGSKMMWTDKQNHNVIFGDNRIKKMSLTDRSHGKLDGKRRLMIDPDIMMDFRDLPFQNDIFKLVVFDPPHLTRAGQNSWMAAKYGKLGENWRDDLRQGFSECFRVLAFEGVLIFKWNETQVKINDVLRLTPVRPLFGHLSGRTGLTHWMVFIKNN